MITIEPVSKENAQDIYNFEIKNRDFFEASLPSRGDEYFKIEVFTRIIDDICEEQNQGLLFMHIIRNESHEMVGRINLFPIQVDHYKRAFELGYRIAEKHQGKGYASEAVKCLTQIAFENYEADCLRALTSPENKASQVILIKNGFSFVMRIPNDVEVNGVWVDSLVYERVK